MFGCGGLRIGVIRGIDFHGGEDSDLSFSRSVAELWSLNREWCDKMVSYVLVSDAAGHTQAERPQVRPHINTTKQFLMLVLVYELTLTSYGLFMCHVSQETFLPYDSRSQLENRLKQHMETTAPSLGCHCYQCDGAVTSNRMNSVLSEEYVRKCSKQT